MKRANMILTLAAALFVVVPFLNGATMTEQAKSFTDLPSQDSPGASGQFKEWMSMLDKASKLPPEQMVIRLTSTLRSTGTIPRAESAAYFLRAQQMVLDVPNYAEIYRNYIEETVRIRATGDSSTSRDDEKIISALGNLPTLKSVELLGEYLSDTRDHKMMRGDELGGAYKPYLDRGRSQCASFALSAIGIQNPPIHRTSSSYEARLEEIEAWKLWYEQVKNGTRKFKFVGSDVEYSLRDRPKTPVREVRDPRQKAQANSKRSSLGNGQRKEDRPLVWPWIAVLVAGGAAGAFWIGRKQKSRNR